MEFRSILFIPPRAPEGILDNYYAQEKGLDLYVRRVFITNNFEELVPRWDIMRFPSQHKSFRTAELAHLPNSVQSVMCKAGRVASWMHHQ